MSLGQTLVLNAAHQAVETCPAEDAIWDVMKGSAFVVEGTGRFCHSQNLDVEIPSVIQQYIYHAPKSVGRERSLPLTPRNVCARDRWLCAYRGNVWLDRNGDEIPSRCTERATTIDHVVPRSRGGENLWESVVGACRPCNHFKGSRTLEEMGWESKNPSWRPTGALARVLVRSGGHENWLKYLK